MIELLMVELFREPRGLAMNGGALAYAVGGWVLGFAALFHPSLTIALAGTLLLAHAMTIAAYLVHECAHNLVFRRSRHNARLGRLLCWLCGASYGTWNDLRYKHFRHHVDNDDVVWFEYDRFFARHPLLTRVVRMLEWLYIPAHDLIMHVIMMLTSFVIPERRKQRGYNVAVLAVRGGLFLLLIALSVKAALLYALAYLLMMHALRFMDLLQHDYPYSPTLYSYAAPPHKGDADWEQAHTFSNPHSLRYPRLNWLTLNFGYHNAHHADTSVPWYRLPDLHREMTGDDPLCVIPFRSQLRLYHANRVSRVSNPQPAGYPKGPRYLEAARDGVGPIGGNAASFLTSF